jgi:acylphosphatase
VDQMDAPSGVPGAASPGASERITIWVRGRVQGVGFRWWTRSRALELGLAGSAANLDDGRVEVIAEGPRVRCEQLLELLREDPPRDPPVDAPRSWFRRPGRVAAVTHRWSAARGATGFHER